MAYIGSTPTSQGFVPAIDYFNGNGSTVLFTLSRNVTTSAQVDVIVDNVIQNPSYAFTVLNKTITFTSAPLAGSNNIWVRYVTLNTSTMVPGAGTVGTTQLGSVEAINSASTMSLKTGGITGLIINGSQNVGIGTSSPAAKLDIMSTTGGSATGVLKLYNAVSGDKYTGIDFHCVTSETYNKIAQITATVTNGGTGLGGAIGGDLIFRTNGSASNIPTEHMRIDSFGRVTMPYQPAFQVCIVESTPISGVVKYNTTKTADPANGMNNAAGIYIAQVAGRYQFNFVAFSDLSTPGPVHIDIMKNEVNFARTFIGDTSTYTPLGTLSCIISLAVNDYVYIRTVNGALHGNANAYFSGFLIG
jgi:hypothetical protein